MSKLNTINPEPLSTLIANVGTVLTFTTDPGGGTPVALRLYGRATTTRMSVSAP